MFNNHPVANLKLERHFYFPHCKLGTYSAVDALTQMSVSIFSASMRFIAEATQCHHILILLWNIN